MLRAESACLPWVEGVRSENVRIHDRYRVRNLPTNFRRCGGMPDAMEFSFFDGG